MRKTEVDEERVIHPVPVSFNYKKPQKVHLYCFDQLTEKEAEKRHRKAVREVTQMYERLETLRRKVSQRLGSVVTYKVLRNDILWRWRNDVVVISMARREFDLLVTNPEALAKLIAGRLI